MAKIWISVIVLCCVVVFAPAQSNAQFILVGTAYKKMEKGGCGLFQTLADFKYKNFENNKVDQRKMYNDFRTGFLDKYPRPQYSASVRSSKEKSGFAIIVEMKQPAFPSCINKIAFFGFGLTMLDAKSRAEKQQKEWCGRACTLINSIQL